MCLGLIAVQTEYEQDRNVINLIKLMIHSAISFYLLPPVWSSLLSVWLRDSANILCIHEN